MSGSHEKLPGFFWVQLGAAAFIGILWLLAPSDKGAGADVAKVDPTMAAALKPIGSVALAKPVVEAGAPRSGDAIVDKNCKVCHSIGLANAPKLDTGAKADWEARLAGGYDAIVTSAIKGKGGMPPRGGDPSLTDDEISAAIKQMLATVGVEVAEASEATPVEAEPAKEVAKVAVEAEPAKEVVKFAEPVVAEAAVAQPVKLEPTKLGESTYKSSCFACHDNGVANSPKFGDKAVWAPRIANGLAALHAGAVNGKGAMPAKGGNPSLTDQAVIEAVNYMLINSQ
jgi:cytochrome c5